MSRCRARFRLVYVVFNTLFNLLTQDDQVRCFENVAAHLTDDGAFVVEAFVPTFLTRLRDDQYVDAEAIGVDEVRARRGAPRPRDATARREPRVPHADGRAPEPDRHPLRLAERARPDGAHRRAAPARPLGRLGAGALHRRQPRRTCPSTDAEQRAPGTGRCYDAGRSPSRPPGGCSAWRDTDATPAIPAPPADPHSTRLHPRCPWCPGPGPRRGPRRVAGVGRVPAGASCPKPERVT